MAASSSNHNDQAQSDVVLDLNNICNIGHPYLELIDPNPDIKKLFNQFHTLFFSDLNDFPKLVQLKWCSNLRKSAGETIPASRRGDKIKIMLNNNLLGNRLRKEIVEQLLHEMIHAYLMATDKEDLNDGSDYHGTNFVSKMTEINNQAKLNITIYHDIPTKKRTSIADERDKYYMWRCQGNCCSQPPFFGFIWINHAEREPQGSDTMWVDSVSSNCEHIFERYNDSDDPKQWLSAWECVKIFNDYLKKEKIQILGFENIPDTMYINYDSEGGHFVSIKEFLPELYDKDDTNRTVCMICFEKITDPRLPSVIAHLNVCSGLRFETQANETLPILKV